MSADKKQPSANASTPARKAWTPKSPVDVVLEQIVRQETRVAALQKELETEKQLLVKLSKAKAALEA